MPKLRIIVDGECMFKGMVKKVKIDIKRKPIVKRKGGRILNVLPDLYPQIVLKAQ